MAKKPKRSKKASSKKSGNVIANFYSAMSTRKKILYATALVTTIIATVSLLVLNNQLTDAGWYTSNWLYVSYVTLLLVIIFILFKYKSLFKFSSLSILSVLLISFFVSSLLSVDYYRYFLDLTSPVEITSTTDSYKSPTLNNIPQEEQVEPAQEESAPIVQQQTQSYTPSESIADKCLKLHTDQLGDDIDNFQRDIEFMRKNLANIEVNADLQPVEDVKILRNKYIKFYNDSRTGSIGVYRQNMISNGCSAYIDEPKPGYVEYYE